jgi:hypothetical protein
MGSALGESGQQYPKAIPHYYRFDSDMQIKDGSIPSQ